MKEDIQSREDIKLFIIQFYNKLLKDKTIQHFFDEIVQKNHLEKHLEIIIDFWEDILLNTLKYKRNAMHPHMVLSKTKPFEKAHFKVWLHHFNTTLDQNFEGEKAFMAKTRALSIATVMEIKIKKS